MPEILQAQILLHTYRVAITDICIGMYYGIVLLPSGIWGGDRYGCFSYCRSIPRAKTGDATSQSGSLYRGNAKINGVVNENGQGRTGPWITDKCWTEYSHATSHYNRHYFCNLRLAPKCWILPDRYARCTATWISTGVTLIFKKLQNCLNGGKVFVIILIIFSWSRKIAY